MNVTTNTFNNDKLSGLFNSQSVSNSSHPTWLDQIREFAALYVVCHHAVRQVIITGNHAHDPLYRFLQLATGFGHYAVDVFIVLSGYCLILPLIKKQHFGSILNFYDGYIEVNFEYLFLLYK